MKAVVVGPIYPYRGGIAHHTTMLVQSLLKTHSVEAISFRRQFPSWLYPGRSDRDPSVDARRVDGRYLLDPLNPWTWWMTANHIHAQKPDIVVIQWWTTFWSVGFGVLARLLRRKRERVVYLIHNVLPHEHFVLDQRLARYALQAGDIHIVQSQREKETLLSLLPGVRTLVAGFPTFDLFRGSPIAPSEARLRLGLPPDLPVVLFFGLVRPYKGLRYLIDAVGALATNGTHVNLVIAGEFWEPETEYRALIAGKGLGDRTFIHNRYIPNESVGDFFAACDVLVAPYLDGTQSAAVNLAGSFGVKIVKTMPISDPMADAACKEWVWVVPPGDSGALAAAIGSAMAAPQCTLVAKLNTDWDDLIAVIEQAACREIGSRQAI